MIDNDTVNSLFDARVEDPDGDKIGTVKQVYLDDGDGRPLFVSVATGLFGTSESFVPLEGADLVGEELRVRYSKEQVKDAPRIEADGALSEDEQERLFRHYGLGGGATSGGVLGSDDTEGAGTVGTERTDESAGYVGTPGVGGTTDDSVGHDTSGPNTDEAMTRSEQRLDVGTERVQTGRARLRKYVVTEQQDVTVPVQHEEVRLEREPITDANVGAATSGPDLSEEEHEVTLSEERVVVDKETVPVERVRLDKDTVTEQEHVTEDVAHEEVTLDQDGDGRTRP